MIETTGTNESLLNADTKTTTQPVVEKKPAQTGQKKLSDTILPPTVSTRKNVILTDTITKKVISTKDPQAPASLLSVGENKLPVDPCASVNLEASVFTESACKNESDGRITLSGFKGGKAPYVFHIYNEANVNAEATHLAKGVYAVLLEDAMKCTRKWQGVVVNEKDCKKDFEFNPEMGEICELEEATATATLTVYGKDGIVYFYKTFASGEKIQWNGTSKSGEVLSGFFVFQIHYQDGRTRKGTVTATK